MSFADTQIRQLKAKLEPKHVKIRKANGASLHYVEGWHVIAEANRIFGYDAWDRRTIATRLRVERRKRPVLRSGLHREGAGERSRGRNHHRAGRLRHR